MAPPAPLKRASDFAPLALFAFALGLYAPTLSNGLTNWDDPTYVVDNPIAAQGLRGLPDAFTKAFDGAWYPLTQALYCVLHAIGGADARLHHLASLLLFALAAALLPLALAAFRIPRGVALVASVLFVAHPFRVESVAWAANLKDPLSLVFLVGSFAAYGRSRTFSAVLFAGAVLSKSMVFPLALLFPCLEWLRGEAPVAAFRRTLPFLFVAALDAVVAGALHTVTPEASSHTWIAGSLLRSLPTVAFLPWWYLGRIVVPWHPRAIYAFEPVTLVDLRFVVAVLLWAALALFSVWTRSRALWLTAVAAFLLPLATVGGLVPMRFHVADRYTLVPSMVVAVLVGSLLVRLLRTPALIAAATLLLTAPLALSTAHEERSWANAIALWQANLADSGSRWEVHYNLAGAYGGAGRWDDAIRELQAALAVAPQRVSMRGDLLFARAAKTDATVQEITSWQSALARGGYSMEALLSVSETVLQQGHKGLADALVDDVLSHAPSAEALTLKAQVLRAEGRAADALGVARHALTLAGDLDSARAELVLALADLGRLDEALAEAEPRGTDVVQKSAVLRAKGLVLIRLGRQDEGMRLLDEARGGR